MGSLRTLLRSHRGLALALIVLALAIKALVPQGYMIAPGKSFAIMLCSGTSATSATVTVPMQPDGEHATKPGATEACAFTALGHAAAPGVDLVLLVAAIALILALGFAPSATPAARRSSYLTPPLRGPPATI